MKTRRGGWKTHLLILLLLGLECSALAESEASSPAAHNPETDEPPAKFMKLSFGGSLRFRFETCHNFNIKGYGKGGDEFLLERLRWHADLRFRNGLRVYAELQDAHQWGSEFGVGDFNGNSPYENPLDIRQMFIQWDHIAGKPWGVKVGRQEIFFGDNRIFGPGDWGNVGSHLWDAAMVRYDINQFAADVFLGKLIKYESASWDIDDQHYDYDVVGMYATLKQLPVNAEAFIVAKLGQSPRIGDASRTEKEHRFTGGFRLNDHIGTCLNYGGLFAYQGGTWGEDRIRAFGANVQVGYTFKNPWQPHLGAEFTYGSGDRDPNDKTMETFDGVFGSRDKLYGRMNLMAWSNLRDYQLSASAKPTARLTTQVDYHFFRLAECYDYWYYSRSKGLRLDPTGAAGSSLGREIDLIVGYRLNKKWSGTLIGGYFEPASFINDTGSSGDAHWACLQILYEF
jgi:hypothetical protein